MALHIPVAPPLFEFQPPVAGVPVAPPAPPMFVAAEPIVPLAPDAPPMFGAGLVRAPSVRYVPPSDGRAWDESELSISIPLKSIYEYFLCPVCLNEVTDCHITPCGHIFCDRCIRECLNRRHVCPLCNGAATADRLVKNHHFDSLFQIVNEQKEANAKKKVADLVSGAKGSAVGPVGGPAIASAPAAVANPIEAVFQKHIRRSLLAYEEYYNELNNNFNKHAAKLRTDYIARIDEIKVKSSYSIKLSSIIDSVTPALPASAVDVKSALPPAPPLVRTKSTEQAVSAAEALAAEYKTAISELTATFRRSVDLLVGSYDSYMTQHLVASPFVLPVKVILVVATKGIRTEVSLRSTDCIKDVVPALLTERAAAMGNPIVSWGPDTQIWIKRPFGAAGDAKAIASAAGADAKSGAGETRMTDLSLLVAEYKLDNGTELHVRNPPAGAANGLRFKSDEPARCFISQYDANNAQQRMDYFKCETCATNWLCKPCATTCHKDHKVTAFMSNHRPSYGCCYCPKKKNCLLAVKK